MRGAHEYDSQFSAIILVSVVVHLMGIVKGTIVVVIAALWTLLSDEWLDRRRRGKANL